MKPIISMLLLLAVTGCATENHGQALSTWPQVSVINAPLHFLTQTNVPLRREYFPKKVAVFLPTVPGAIFGIPSGDSIYSEVLADNQPVTIDLSKKVSVVEASAQRLQQDWQDLGLQITPKEARLARVGTFAFNAANGEVLGAVGFMEEQSRDTLILVYVDRACNITGSVALEGDVFNHEISLPKKGFYFIRVEKSARNSYHLDLFEEDDDVGFAIQVPNFEQI